MKNALSAIVLLIALCMIILAGALTGVVRSSSAPAQVCGGSCDGGGGPPYACDQWHWGEYWYTVPGNWSYPVYYCNPSNNSWIRVN